MEGKRMLKMMVLCIVVVLCAGRGALAGEVVAWGYNHQGQCDVPEPNEGFIAVAGGYAHSLGLKADGSIVAWGLNNYGQRNVPEPNEGFVAVAGGGYHSLGLKADGSIAAWGWNDYGQCDVPLPNEGFIAVAAGGHHSLGLKADGSIVAWGLYTSGQCSVPLPNQDFVAVAGGWAHSLGLKGDGSIAAWGDNSNGQRNVPLPNEGFIAVGGGAWHSLGLKADGSIVAWGENFDGQCNVPLPNEGFVAVAGGWAHSLGLKADESVAAWGDSYFGQCDVPEPNAGFIAVAAGGYHSLGLKAEPMGTAITYQGRLIDANSTADGPYDFEFRLYDEENVQQGNTVRAEDLEVIDGYFTVELDFGSDVFDGLARWLEIGVRAGDSNDPNTFTTLSPRQEVTPTAYALHAKTAESIAAVSYVETDPQVGAISNNYVPKWDGSALVTGTIYDNGNVGIWTTSPSVPLEVAGNAKFNESVILGDAASDNLEINAYVSKDLNLIQWTKPNLNLGSDAINAGNIVVNDAGVARFEVLGSTGDVTISGNVGIGTTSPSHLLDVDGSLRLRQSGGGNPGASLIELGNRSGSRTYGINFNAYYDGNWKYRSSDEAASIGFEDGGDLVFSTMAYGAANNPLTFSPRITIKNNGNVGIGTTNPAGTLDVNGSIYQRGSQLHADYVFEPGYELESIEEHCRYMWENKHLKAIPEKRFDESGQEIIEVGAYRKGIVEELEKAHIYIDQLHRRIAKLEAIIGKLAQGREGEEQ